MTMLSVLKQAGRVALLGLAMSGSAMFASAAPALADDAESSYKIEVDQYYDSSRYRIKGYDNYDYCLSDRGIAKALSAWKFEDVEFIKAINDWKVIVLFVFDDYYYVAGVDRCTGDVEYVTKFYGWEDYHVQYEEEEEYVEPRRKKSYSY